MPIQRPTSRCKFVISSLDACGKQSDFNRNSGGPSGNEHPAAASADQQMVEASASVTATSNSDDRPMEVDDADKDETTRPSNESMEVDDASEDEATRPSNESMEVDFLVQSGTKSGVAGGPLTVDISDDDEASSVHSQSE
jgi:hypothetical protein